MLQCLSSLQKTSNAQMDSGNAPHSRLKLDIHEPEPIGPRVKLAGLRTEPDQDQINLAHQFIWRYRNNYFSPINYHTLYPTLLLV